MEYHVYWLLKSSCFELSRDGKYGLFWAKKLMERLYLLITGKFLFWTFLKWEIWYFLSLKNSGTMIFTDYWKVLVLNFLEMGNAVFFWSGKLIQRWYLLGLFELSKIFQDLENIVFCAVNFPTHCPPGNAKYQMIFLPSSLHLWWKV